jgi:hypothetical protein
MNEHDLALDELCLPARHEEAAIARLPAFGSRHRGRDGAVKPVLREFPEDIAADRWQDPTSWRYRTSWRSRDCGQILGTLCRC